jgi:hypothetical protein
LAVVQLDLAATPGESDLLFVGHGLAVKHQHRVMVWGDMDRGGVGTKASDGLWAFRRGDGFPPVARTAVGMER